MTTAHEAKARSIVDQHVSKISHMGATFDDADDGLASAIAEALREAEAPLLKKIVELSGQIQRMEEINENLRSAVRDQPIKWNDEYYEMKLKEARLTEREACAKIAETAKTLKAWLPTNDDGSGEAEHTTIHGQAIAASIRSRNDE